MLLVGTRSADHIRASGHSGCIAMEVTLPFENRPDTWPHPNASQNVRFLLHRGRRPYMALSFAARLQYVWNRGQRGSGWRALKMSLMTPIRTLADCDASRFEDDILGGVVLLSIRQAALPA